MGCKGQRAPKQVLWESDTWHTSCSPRWRNRCYLGHSIAVPVPLYRQNLATSGKLRANSWSVVDLFFFSIVPWCPLSFLLSGVGKASDKRENLTHATAHAFRNHWQTWDQANCSAFAGVTQVTHLSVEFRWFSLFDQQNLCCLHVLVEAWLLEIGICFFSCQISCILQNLVCIIFPSFALS